MRWLSNPQSPFKMGCTPQEQYNATRQYPGVPSTIT